MKELALVLKHYVQEDFEWKRYGFVLTISAILIALNYSIDIEGKFLLSHKSTSSHILYYFASNSIIYFLSLIPLLKFAGKLQLIKNPVYILYSLIFLFLLSVDRGSSFYKEWTYNLEFYNRYFWNRVLGNLEGIYIYTVPIIIIFILNRSFKNIFGLSFSGSKLKIFLIMISFTIPLVIWASFQKDFLATYPRFRFWQYPSILGQKNILAEVVFLISYSFDFFIVEFAFRGALVIFLARYIGKEAILPMAVLYVALHFGKPMAEAISSLFGGFILGIFAYKLRSIWGGVFVHLGLALFMEAAALWQYLGR